MKKYTIIIEDTVFKVTKRQLSKIFEILELNDETALMEYLEEHKSEYTEVGSIFFSFRSEPPSIHMDTLKINILLTK